MIYVQTLWKRYLFFKTAAPVEEELYDEVGRWRGGRGVRFCAIKAPVSLPGQQQQHELQNTTICVPSRCLSDCETSPSELCTSTEIDRYGTWHSIMLL